MRATDKRIELLPYQLNAMEIRLDGVFTRDRTGETISTAFVESAVDQVLSKRFVKKQQMSWSRRRAHLLLQVRTQAMNEDLRGKFDEWYPGFNAQSGGQARAA